MLTYNLCEQVSAEDDPRNRRYGMYYSYERQRREVAVELDGDTVLWEAYKLAA